MTFEVGLLYKLYWYDLGLVYKLHLLFREIGTVKIFLKMKLETMDLKALTLLR